MAIQLTDVGSIGFDLGDLAIDKTKEQGMWQISFKGNGELKIVPAHSKKFTKNAQGAWKKQMKARGAERPDDLPETIQETLSVELLHELVKGWKTLVREDKLDHPSLVEVKAQATKVYESTGDATPEGYVLIPYMSMGRQLLEFSVENAKLVIKASDDMQAEINTLARNKDLYSVGGLDSGD